MFEQLRELRNRYGYEVCAVVSGDKGSLVDKLRGENIPFEAFQFGDLGRPLSLFLRILKLARLFRRRRFDVVHTHLLQSMLVGRMAAWLADVPVRVAMIAGPTHLEADASRWLDRTTCWMDNMLIPSCEYSQTLCRGMGISDRRLALIYYGPDERRFDSETVVPADLRAEYGWGDDTLLVGLVAYFYGVLPVSRWVPAAVHGRATKGHEYLINAVPSILREFPNARFLLVGSAWSAHGNEYMEDMKALVQRLGLGDKVVFSGFRPDIANVLRALHVVVMPAVTENLDGSVEALLLERPAVASRVGGLVDAVRDGVTGVLVEPANVEALAAGILQLLRDPTRAQALGRAGRQLMLQRFTLTRTVDDLDQLYRRLLEPGGRRRTGYRLWVSLLRLALFVPFSAYLADRLLIEIYGSRRVVLQLLRWRIKGRMHSALPVRIMRKVKQLLLKIMRKVKRVLRRILLSQRR
ncbi:MAG TPA: glycosyltransferase family 4 protein [Chloroflexota bacterium]|nr:glycosyltransferase family 4 protein [Chloroflexota bacterium]